MKNYLTFSRQALYDLVWERPMREVAKDFGLSDVGLAKRCAAVAVPVPPRGGSGQWPFAVLFYPAPFARPCARAATLLAPSWRFALRVRVRRLKSGVAAFVRQKRGGVFVPGILAPGSDSVGPSMAQV